MLKSSFMDEGNGTGVVALNFAKRSTNTFESAVESTNLGHFLILIQTGGYPCDYDNI